MEIKKYIDKLKKFYEQIMAYIEKETDDDDDLFKDLIDNNYLLDKKEDFRLALKLISTISNNHHRAPNFNRKIEKILQHYSMQIKQTFTNAEICDIFQKSKLILLFLFEQKIIVSDKTIHPFFRDKHDEKNFYLSIFFYPEIKNILSYDETRSINKKLIKYELTDSEVFNSKRKKGENDKYICELIREDSIDLFVQYVNKQNLSLNKTEINPSIFETNEYLYNKNSTLIEYAAFFGSFQIFQYLRLSGVEMDKSLWNYVIHGKNAEIIHLLESDNIYTNQVDCVIEEAIKCHHNDIANYII